MINDFKHSQYAHCESGVVSSMLTNSGLKISEPMAFGLTSTLSFAFFPIVKVNGMPLIAYRAIPKNIINKIEKSLKIKLFKKSFRNMLEANLELDKALENGKLVGLQTSVFYLPYMPSDMRFHFNAHNLLVYGKIEKNYQISDPVFENIVECSQKDLIKARFAKGVFSPKGFMYYVDKLPKNIEFETILKKAIRKNAKSMLTVFPYAGVKGMRKLVSHIEKLQEKDERYIKNYLTHIVRMQEEIGTGGGGFRYLYAAFLKEAIKYNLDVDKLNKASELLTLSGDTLRNFALKCVESAKKIERFNPKEISDILIEASNYEEKAFKILKSI
ncbi:BtrH N-terminal domain-containing protein [Aliarcobacter trophiarum]|uniref:BtrH N-terminal domain-containing protein n=1 Tax=Aliarcobacter trophiarum TaxID=708186 RepID=UPI00100A5B65|nr:BtrH N-terminal domain-containing protein [Aliarcobacter trophiarum]RXI28252.1 peptidase [Aliarcobacter trophiarum]